MGIGDSCRAGKGATNNRLLLLATATATVFAFVGWRIRVPLAVELRLREARRTSRSTRRPIGADAVRYLREVLASDGDPVRRLDATCLLMTEGDSSAVPTLTRALWDADPRVSEQALWSLFVIGGLRYGGPWMQDIPDEELLGLMRKTRDPRVRFQLFCDLCYAKRPAMRAAGEMVLASEPSFPGWELATALNGLMGASPPAPRPSAEVPGASTRGGPPRRGPAEPRCTAPRGGPTKARTDRREAGHAR